MDTSKIIKGAVSSGRYTVTAPIVKEDYGLQLQIEGIDLPSSYQVDFSNSENSGTSVTMVGSSNKVLIPREFIETGKDIFAFLYVVGSNYGRTVYKFRIPNKLRPDRTNIAPTPEEQSVIDQAISALNTAVAKTAQDVIDADASAQMASEFAEDARDAEARAAARAATAKNHADRAEQARDDAQTYANNASASATASAQSASEAETARQATTSLVAEAQRYADASAQSASASANSASQAQGFAQSASASAQSASTSASAALTYANTASQKATEASTSAQTASTKATEASQSASQALSYKTDTESAKTASQTAQTASESARDSAIQAKTDAESAKADAESARDEAQQAVASISGALADKADIITDTASGSIASFSDGADNLPLKSLVIDINPIQDLSNGDPSPENICPISGLTQVDVNHSGADMTNPTTITIPLGQTVYGAKLYPLEGKALINMAMVDLGTLTPYKTPSNVFMWHVLTPTNGTILCSNYATAGSTPSSMPDKSVCTTHTIGAYYPVALKDSSYYNATVGEMQTAMSGVQLCYELAEPIEIQLTPNQVNSLLGVNNIWADSGDCTAEYRADTKLYIAKKIAEAISALS